MKVQWFKVHSKARSRLSLTHLAVQPLSRVKSLDGPRVIAYNWSKAVCLSVCVCLSTRVAQIITATRRGICNPARGSAHSTRTVPTDIHSPTFPQWNLLKTNKSPEFPLREYPPLRIFPPWNPLSPENFPQTNFRTFPLTELSQAFPQRAAGITNGGHGGMPPRQKKNVILLYVR